MIFGGMNGKLPSKNSFWKWISCAEGENDEMGIPNSGDRSRLNYDYSELDKRKKLRLPTSGMWTLHK